MTMTLQFEPSHLGRIRQLTEELTVEKELYLFFKLSPDMFCVADRDGCLCMVNAAWTKILGWTEEELLNISFLELVHPDDMDNTIRAMDHMDEQEVIRFHNRYRKKGSDEYIVLEWSATAWIDGLTYATARQVPVQCLVCPEAAERFGWNHRPDETLNGSKS